MTENEFKEKFLAQVKSLLDYVLESQYSDFYINKYKGLNISSKSINSYADFLRIPILTKDEILQVPLNERIFVDIDKITKYSASSGTTNTNKPLILPRTDDHLIPATEKNSYYFPFSHLGLKRGFVLLPTIRAIGKVENSPIPMFPGDPQKLSLAAKIAKELSPDAILSTPTLLTLFIAELKKVDFDLQQIRLIRLGSEFCSKQRADYFRKSFPNADVSFAYGSSEMAGLIGYRCAYIEHEAPSFFHPHKRNILEVLDEDDITPVSSGQIILTSLKLPAFPLIRYQTADYADITSNTCDCGEKYTIKVNGKRDFDVLRFSGVTLHTQVIADAIPEFDTPGVPWFQLHVFERNQGDMMINELELHLASEDINNVKGKETDIAKLVQKQLYLTATKTLEDLVDEGLFLPLKVKFIEKAPVEAKSKHIISHLE
ncbi:MAG: hypothetical protein WCP14_02935 [bacterium]